MSTATLLARGTGASVVIDRCQVCNSEQLKPVLFLGYLPPVNTMPNIGCRPQEQASYPTQLLVCNDCSLVQLGLIVDPQILFPPEYPYSSATTRVLRDNFAELFSESIKIIPLNKDDLVLDIGSNDGTLLSNFQQGGYRVQGIEPTLMGKRAIERGIPTEETFFDVATADRLGGSIGQAKVITATNVFAHIENVHEVVDGILLLLAHNGVFVSESHYLLSLIETLQYDTIYHEHLRYYSLKSLSHLLNGHGLEVIHAKRIPTHGGSIRVYAARTGEHPVAPTVKQMLDFESSCSLNTDLLTKFRQRVMLSNWHCINSYTTSRQKDRGYLGSVHRLGQAP